MGPEHRAGQADGDRAVDPHRELDVLRHAGQLRVDRSAASSTSGASAGVVGTIVWPRRLAIANPAPSLPLFGSDWPPVASTTADAQTRR